MSHERNSPNWLRFNRPGVVNLASCLRTEPAQQWGERNLHRGSTPLKFLVDPNAPRSDSSSEASDLGFV